MVVEAVFLACVSEVNRRAPFEAIHQMEFHMRLHVARTFECEVVQSKTGESANRREGEVDPC